jgi:hypothetical protein
MESQVYYAMADHWRNYSPGQRFGFEVFEPYLATQGIQTELLALRTPEEEHILRQKGHYFQKARFFLTWAQRRKEHIRRFHRVLP